MNLLHEDIVSFLEDFAPLALQEPYDNSGWQCGNPKTKCTGTLFCLDVTMEVLKDAITKKCNLIIAHHPLLFKPLRNIISGNPTSDLIFEAIRHNISMYACHTNADNVRHGVNKMIADKLGLVNTLVLRPAEGALMKIVTFCPESHADAVRNALFLAGCGKIGNYDQCSFNTPGTGTFRGNENSNPFSGKKGSLKMEKEVRIESVFAVSDKNKVIIALRAAHPYEEIAYDILKLENPHPGIGSGMIGDLPKPMEEADFLHQVKSKLKAQCLKHTKLLGKKVKTVALCGGSGSFLLHDAIQSEAQVFVSADFKYHQYFDANGQIVIADPGHYETERFTPQLFIEVIRKKIPTFALHLTEINTNPVNYLNHG